MRALLIHESDNVAVALEEIAAGAVVDVAGSKAAVQVKSRQAVPFAHKIAIQPIAKSASVVKYGAPVAMATEEIQPGDGVHGHNARSIYAPQAGEGKR